MSVFNAQLIINYLQKHYKIIYTNLTFYRHIYYADIGISTINHNCLINKVYASGADKQKELAILKALVEVVERIVFVSPYVGPVEFIEDQTYVKTIDHQRVPLADLSPYFSNKAFNSKGLACHFEMDVAKKFSRFEYYEQLILNHLDSTYLKLISPLNVSKITNLLQQPCAFEICLIYLNPIIYCLLWHSSHPTFLLGSACNTDVKNACLKALIEANGKWEKIEKNFHLLTQMADNKLQHPLTPGFYVLDIQHKEPLIIRRHHNMLSHLQLYMMQSV